MCQKLPSRHGNNRQRGSRSLVRQYIWWPVDLRERSQSLCNTKTMIKCYDIINSGKCIEFLWMTTKDKKKMLNILLTCIVFNYNGSTVASLHTAGRPAVCCNIWAQAVCQAAAQVYQDRIPEPQRWSEVCLGLGGTKSWGNTQDHHFIDKLQISNHYTLQLHAHIATVERSK